jgi:hypothetical protein
MEAPCAVDSHARTAETRVYLPVSSSLSHRACRHHRSCQSRRRLIDTLDARGLYTPNVAGDIADPADSFRTAGYKASFRVQAQLAQSEILGDLALGTGGAFTTIAMIWTLPCAKQWLPLQLLTFWDFLRKT